MKLDMIPPVRSSADLPEAIDFADRYTHARWYVQKRAESLRETAMIPPEWSQPMPVQAALKFIRGGKSDMTLLRDVIQQAREGGLLQHPVIVAAVNWREWMHPRGKDGKFIEKFSLVDVYSNPDDPVDSPNAVRRRASITSLTPDGAQLEYRDETGAPVSSDPANGFPDLIASEDISTKISLAPQAIAKMEQFSPEKLAEKIREKADALEPEITAALVDMSGKVGGEMTGLEYAKKEIPSLTRKITDDARFEGITEEAAAAKIGDSIRYTMLFDPKDLKAGYESAVNTLNEKGWNVFKIKDSFGKENAEYRGINTQFKMPDGTIVELQFHTEQSFTLKNGQLHKIYEEARLLDPNDPANREALAGFRQQMIDLSNSITIPDGYSVAATPGVAL